MGGNSEFKFVALSQPSRWHSVSLGEQSVNLTLQYAPVLTSSGTGCGGGAGGGVTGLLGTSGLAGMSRFGLGGGGVGAGAVSVADKTADFGGLGGGFAV